MNNRSVTPYSELVAHARRHAVISSCVDLLDWDAETYMPRGGVRHRGEQMATLAGLVHEGLTSSRMSDLLDEAERDVSSRDGETPERVNVRELRRQYARALRIPRDLVEEKARTSAMAQRIWLEAREESEFSRFLPWLERLIALAREEASAIDSERPAYDVLLEHYEPGMTGEGVAELLGGVGDGVRRLLDAISSSRKRPRFGVLRREFPVERQRLFAQAVAASVGFDLECGRLDSGAHPSCVFIGPGDTRLTTRYAERSFTRGFFATLHEVGHALYDQGFDAEQFGLPMAQAPSLGLHESQARLWENFVGRSLPFWKHFFPRLKNVFPEAIGDAKLEAFHAAVNRVEATLTRSDADEVTYNLHVLVRFELERAMIEGSLSAAELPAAWRIGYRKHLGVEPTGDAEGCLQDGHWAAGMFGYFPTYTLGNIYAAQLFGVARRGLPGLDECFSEGDFSPLIAWLRQHVYQHGHRWSAGELVKRATGSAPDPRALIDHLRARCGPVYGF